MNSRVRSCLRMSPASGSSSGHSNSASLLHQRSSPVLRVPVTIDPEFARGPTRESGRAVLGLPPGGREPRDGLKGRRPYAEPIRPITSMSSSSHRPGSGPLPDANWSARTPTTSWTYALITNSIRGILIVWINQKLWPDSRASSSTTSGPRHWLDPDDHGRISHQEGVLG